MAVTDLYNYHYKCTNDVSLYTRYADIEQILTKDYFKDFPNINVLNWCIMFRKKTQLHCISHREAATQSNADGFKWDT